MRIVMAWVRGLRLVIHLMVGLLQAAAINLDFTHSLNGQRAMHWWTGVLLEILNIRLVVRGEPLEGARLTVANHVSWLDIPLIGACEPTRFLSKSEIANWPIAGWLANACGTFYIRRGKGGARPLLDKLVPHLRRGGSIVVFPEGTTGDGHEVLPFYSRLFAAATESGSPVQPLAIRYGRAADGSNVAPFVGDDDLVSHILRLLKTPELVAEVTYCAPIYPRGLDRDQVCQAAYLAIAAVVVPAQTIEEAPRDQPLPV